MFRNQPLVAFDDKQGRSPLLRNAVTTATIGTVGAAAYYGTRRYLRDPGRAFQAYEFFSKIENLSPNRLLRTFGTSEMLSSYTDEALTIPRGKLFVGSNLSPMGKHLQRMLGTNYDLQTMGQELRFRPIPGSPYQQLEGIAGVGVRFYRGEAIGNKFGPGRIAASSQRLGAELAGAPRLRDMLPKSYGFGKLETARRTLHKLKEAQRPTALYTEGIGEYFPGAVKLTGKPVRNLLGKAERDAFLMGERVQTLLADTTRLGVWKGTYNKLVTLPFGGGPNKGLINELLTKRALPIYAGIVGLGFADYLTKHIFSDAAIDVYQGARKAHAEATDKLPGARRVTDLYEKVVPGPQYGPLALPLAGVTAGVAWHYQKVLRGLMTEGERSISARVFSRASDKASDIFLKFFNKRSPLAIGLVAGFAAMIPFIPGMLGSRKTKHELEDTYSGKEPVPIRAGRWWDLGTTPWEGNRIKEFRPHWSVLRRTHAEEVSLYGSESNYWAHQPLLHPLKWLKDPYYLEREHYSDRPYPITSPAFSNVPLVGPLLAATIGRFVKPEKRMHPEWNVEDYDIGSSRLRPKGPEAIAPTTPQREFGLRDTVRREVLAYTEMIGLPGFIARTLYGNAYPGQSGKDVYLQGSRQMENISRRYYEKELGAGYGPTPEGEFTGYSEPLRRFIQPEPKRIQVNEIANAMPSWLPGEDYFMNFKTGDPYAKIAEGYARLPGAGYEALHPEIAGVDPEDYPDIVKMSILGDVAPYSVEYRRLESGVGRMSAGDTELKIEYEKIRERVKAMKDSVVRTDDRKFSEEVTKATGTVSRVSGAGIELQEFPGRVFRMSSVGYSAADISAMVLGEHNDWSKAQVASEVDARQRRLVDFFNNNLSPGTEVGITVPVGALESQEQISAVFDAEGTNVNKLLMHEGLAQYRKDYGGPEAQAMFGPIARAFGAFAESVSFTGDESRLNPLRYLPSPYHTKFWQERTPLAQYQQQEVEGARMRRWQHPIEDFVMPYIRGTYRRIIGDPGIPQLTQYKRDLNTMSDMLEYLRDMRIAGVSSELHGRYTSQASRTAIGANLFGSQSFIASTLSGRDAAYFNKFIRESDPNERRKILATVPEEMGRALTAQWTSAQADIARAQGQEVPEIGEGGRLYTEQELSEFSNADTKLNYGDYQRSKEVAEFFVSHGINLPEEASSPLYNPAIDYEDVKLKVIQQEGYDSHDFGIFEDRAALLWRKPYIDGAVRELTGPDRRSVEEVRKSVEAMIMAAHDKNPQVMYAASSANVNRGNVRVDVDMDNKDKLFKDMRRNPEAYK